MRRNKQIRSVLSKRRKKKYSEAETLKTLAEQLGELGKLIENVVTIFNKNRKTQECIEQIIEDLKPRRYEDT